MGTTLVKRPATRPVRLAFVVHVMQVAGAEVLVRETIHRLAGSIRPTIFCLDALGELGERLRQDGVEVVCLGRRPGRDLGLVRRLAGALREREVEVVHAHQYTPFFYAALARLWSGNAFRLILTEHGRHFPDRVSPLRRAANRLVLGRLADEVCAVSAFSADRLRRRDGFSGAVRVIENGTDVSHFEPGDDRPAARRRLGLDPDRRVVLHVARFHPVKGQQVLLHAFGDVAAARPDVDLLLAGDGPLRGELEALSGGLGLSARVHFLGVRHDVPELLRAADVFVLTSRSEAAPLTLLEAMAARVPVVATAVGGIPEMVRHGREGLLVPRDDAAATARALLQHLDDPAAAAALAEAGAARVHERYQLERCVDRYAALYRRLAGRA